MKTILLSLFCSTSFLVFGQRDLIIPQPKCQEIEGMNFDNVAWYEGDDGIFYPDFPQNGSVTMCNEQGNVEMDMFFVEGSLFWERFWDDMGIKLRLYSGEAYIENCYDKEGEEIDCD